MHLNGATAIGPPSFLRENDQRTSHKRKLELSSEPLLPCFPSGTPRRFRGLSQAHSFLPVQTSVTDNLGYQFHGHVQPTVMAQFTDSQHPYRRFSEMYTVGEYVFWVQPTPSAVRRDCLSIANQLSFITHVRDGILANLPSLAPGRAAGDADEEEQKDQEHEDEANEAENAAWREIHEQFHKQIHEVLDNFPSTLPNASAVVKWTAQAIQMVHDLPEALTVEFDEILALIPPLEKLGSMFAPRQWSRLSRDRPCLMSLAEVNYELRLWADYVDPVVWWDWSRRFIAPLGFIAAPAQTALPADGRKSETGLECTLYTVQIQGPCQIPRIFDSNRYQTLVSPGNLGERICFRWSHHDRALVPDRFADDKRGHNLARIGPFFSLGSASAPPSSHPQVSRSTRSTQAQYHANLVAELVGADAKHNPADMRARHKTISITRDLLASAGKANICCGQAQIGWQWQDASLESNAAYLDGFREFTWQPQAGMEVNFNDPEKNPNNLVRQTGELLLAWLETSKQAQTVAANWQIHNNPAEGTQIEFPVWMDAAVNGCGLLEAAVLQCMQSHDGRGAYTLWAYGQKTYETRGDKRMQMSRDRVQDVKLLLSNSPLIKQLTGEEANDLDQRMRVFLNACLLRNAPRGARAPTWVGNFAFQTALAVLREELTNLIHQLQTPDDAKIMDCLATYFFFQEGDGDVHYFASVRQNECIDLLLKFSEVTCPAQYVQIVWGFIFDLSTQGPDTHRNFPEALCEDNRFYSKIAEQKPGQTFPRHACVWPLTSIVLSVK